VSNDLLKVEQHEQVVLLTLNRPERHHALNYELATAIAKAVDDAENSDDIRDMLEMSGVEALEHEVKSSSAAVAYERVAKSTLPIIAAINGICYGGGALLALACDIRVANELSTYRFPGAEYGLVVGAAWLPRLVGTSKAKELIYTARKFAAQEALDCGLLSHVYPTDEVISNAMQMAAQIAKNSPIAVQESKRVIDLATLESNAEQLESEINEILRGSPEQKARFNHATTKVTGKST
jgi:enoyl-CoA hydratase/carnithine racemase